VAGVTPACFLIYPRRGFSTQHLGRALVTSVVPYWARETELFWRSFRPTHCGEPGKWQSHTVDWQVRAEALEPRELGFKPSSATCWVCSLGPFT